MPYKGKLVHFTYQFNNGDAPVELGIMMFLDGQVQPYSVNGSEAKEIHAFDLCGRAIDNYQFEFDPVTGETGDELFLYIIGIYDISSNPETTTALPFLHAVSQSFPLVIVMEESSTHLHPGQSSAVQVATVDAEDNSSGGEIFRLKHEAGADTLTLELQTLSGEYRIHVFINHTPFLYTDISADGEHKQLIDLSLFDIDSDSFIYEVAVPTHGHERMAPTPVLKTETFFW